MVCSKLKAMVFSILAVSLLSFGSVSAAWWSIGGNDEKEKTVVVIVSEKGDFSTLKNAIQAADLTETLEGQGPFTVFAPTNEAFDKLGKEKLDDLMKPENKEKLKEVLLFHVVPGKVMSKDIESGSVQTASGKNLDVEVQGSSVKVNGVSVKKADIEGKNGVVHVIDTVLIP